MERCAAALNHADDLAGVLAAAWDAFEVIISASGAGADTSAEFSVSLVYALTVAADGRDAIIGAPSLPGRPAGEQPDGTYGPALVGRPGETAAAIAALSAVLAARLSGAADRAADPADRVACLTGAEHAHEIHALLAGPLP
jgi:hypothetical protein